MNLNEEPGVRLNGNMQVLSVSVKHCGDVCNDVYSHVVMIIIIGGSGWPSEVTRQ